VAEYTRTSGTDGERVLLTSSESHYQVNWDTRRYDVGPADTVRIAVSVGTTRLGFADVVMIQNGSGSGSVDPDRYIPLVAGRTLPIKFRIETGIAAALTVAPAVASIPAGTTQQYTATVTDLHGSAVPGRVVAWSTSDPSVAAMSQDGTATGLGAGATTVTATSGSLSATASLTVTSPRWTPTGTGGQGNFGVWGSSASDVYMANWVGIWHFDGARWKTVPELEWHGTLDVYGFGADDVWAVGPAGRILRYDGKAWSGERYDGEGVFAEPLGIWDNPPRNHYLWGVWGPAPNDVFVAGDSGTVLHWDGATWSRMNTGTREGLRRVWGTSGSNVYVSGIGGVLLHYDGSAWSRVVVPTTETLERIWGSSPTNVYVGGARATLLHFDGSGWRRVELPVDPSYTVHAVWGTSASNVFVAGSGGFVLRWDGAHWLREDSGRPEQILGLWGPTDTDVFASMAGGWLSRR
jgi:hypothetical protein